MKKIILQCAAVLFLGFLLQWGVFTYWLADIPNNIPGTALNIRGLAILVWLVLVYILFLKRYLREEPEASFGSLMSIVLLSALLAEGGFQLIREFTVIGASQIELARDFLVSTIVLTLLFGIVGFLVAYQLKTKRTLTVIMIILGLLLVYSLFAVFP